MNYSRCRGQGRSSQTLQPFPLTQWDPTGTEGITAKLGWGAYETQKNKVSQRTEPKSQAKKSPVKKSSPICKGQVILF